MKTSFRSAAVATLVLSSTSAFAQSWDPVRQAAGWARVDKDGSIAFFDPASRKIYSWMKEGGVLGSVDVSKLDRTPEKWVVDFDFNAWVVAGRELIYVEKSGKTYTAKLPYEVGDLTWDARGFYLSYKTPEPYIEMRNFDSGSVVWYIRNRAMKDEAAPVALHRIAINESQTLFIASRNSLQLETVDCNNGRIKGASSFTFSSGLAPSLALGTQDRGAVEWWLNRNTAVSAVPASQIPTLQQSGLLLAIENLTAGTIEFVPTGLSEQHTFIGLADSEAVFLVPGGGLVFLPLKG